VKSNMYSIGSCNAIKSDTTLALLKAKRDELVAIRKETN